VHITSGGLKEMFEGDVTDGMCKIMFTTVNVGTNYCVYHTQTQGGRTPVGVNRN
jgi:hypothetical protein